MTKGLSRFCTEFEKPEEIEKRSFEIIRSELPHALNPVLAPVIMRVIHTTADFEYANSLAFSEGVIKLASYAFRGGAVIVSDTNMVKAGVDKTRLNALNSEIYCFIGDDDVAHNARQNGTTRAKAAVDKAALIEKPLIFAVGNAPTALIRICELKEAGKLNPQLVIGVPVGFVNVAEAKEMLIGSGIAYITARGRKGGSNVAAAICNALLRIAAEEQASPH
ncbi:MAG: precorrin-8X methylmutase [Clostridiales bacterium]|jgi:precorrin-8X/cobalt-precorrin-8 methylmutase|nr:precorrin-8X methylmutase [Clostridiales bacterium]